MIELKTIARLLKTTVIGRAFCSHNHIKVGFDFEIMYGAHYYGKVADYKCSKCKKESIRTTSNIYVRLPYY